MAARDNSNFHDFDRGHEDDTEWVEPITIHLAGEDFRALGEAPAEVLDDLTSSIGGDGRGNVTYDKLSILRFLRGVILDEIRVEVPARTAPANVVEGDEPTPIKTLPATVAWEPVDDLARFNALVSSKRRVIKLERLGDVVQWLMERYSGRPS
jgi:hypothetical protein